MPIPTLILEPTALNSVLPLSPPTHVPEPLGEVFLSHLLHTLEERRLGL